MNARSSAAMPLLLLLAGAACADRTTIVGYVYRDTAGAAFIVEEFHGKAIFYGSVRLKGTEAPGLDIQAPVLQRAPSWRHHGRPIPAAFTHVGRVSGKAQGWRVLALTEVAWVKKRAEFLAVDEAAAIKHAARGRAHELAGRLSDALAGYRRAVATLEATGVPLTEMARRSRQGWRAGRRLRGILIELSARFGRHYETAFTREGLEGIASADRAVAARLAIALCLHHARHSGGHHTVRPRHASDHPRLALLYERLALEKMRGPTGARPLDGAEFAAFREKGRVRALLESQETAAQGKDRKAIPSLLASLENPKEDGRVRRGALGAIVALASENEARELVRCLGVFGFSDEVARAIARTPHGKSVLPALRRTLAAGTLAERHGAIAALRLLEARAEAPAIRAFLDHADARLAAAALEALASLADKTSLPRALALLETSSDRLVRRAAASAVARLAGWNDAQQLIKHLKGTDAGRKALVVEVLALIDRSRFGPMFRETASRGVPGHLRELFAALALHYLGDPAGNASILEFARKAKPVRMHMAEARLPPPRAWAHRQMPRAYRYVVELARRLAGPPAPNAPFSLYPFGARDFEDLRKKVVAILEQKLRK